MATASCWLSVPTGRVADYSYARLHGAPAPFAAGCAKSAGKYTVPLEATAKEVGWACGALEEAVLEAVAVAALRLGGSDLRA